MQSHRDFEQLHTGNLAATGGRGAVGPFVAVTARLKARGTGVFLPFSCEEKTCGPSWLWQPDRWPEEHVCSHRSLWLWQPDQWPEGRVFSPFFVAVAARPVAGGTCWLSPFFVAVATRPIARGTGVFSPFSCEEKTCRKYSHGMLSF